MTNKFLVARSVEMENPQLSVSIFDRNRNLEERNKMLQKVSAFLNFFVVFCCKMNMMTIRKNL